MHHSACFHVRDTGFLCRKCVSCKGITRFMQFSFSDTHYNSVFGVSRTKNKKEPRKLPLTDKSQTNFRDIYMTISVLFVFPALCLDRELDSVRGDDNGADFRLGQVAYYIEGLEVMAELLMFSDRNCKQQTVILSAVDSS